MPDADSNSSPRMGGDRSHRDEPSGSEKNGQLREVRIMNKATGTYAGRGTVVHPTGSSPTITAHLAKNKDEGLVVRHE